MENIPHELFEEFPNEKRLIEQLTKTNYEFRRLATAYHDVNHEIWRIETESPMASDELIENLKKRRLVLKDDIAEALIKLERRM